ncbi:MAG: TonB family protein [Sandaracinaceae bacterium]
MALSEGQLIAGKYRIERLLGEGGMGAVYVATNTVLQREVALKVMTERFAAVPEAVERFHREAIAASRVTHPSIVQVFDAGAHDGKPWIAMELLDGQSLGERLDEHGSMSLDETMKMAGGVLAALAEVHDEGIVHRDLKPDNVFLAKVRGGTDFVPKVLDFSITKDTSGEKLNKLTATGAVVGTAYYLSPEQAKGLPDIDARADVYAMGVVFFECLSGRMPYEADTITQLIAKMFTEAPPPLSSVAPNVPKPVADVVDTCLLPDREARFQSAKALLGALQAALEASKGQDAFAPAAGMAATAMLHAAGPSATGPLPGQIPGTLAGSPGHASSPGIGHAGVSHPGVSHPGVSYPGHPASHPGHPASHPGSYPGHPGSHPGHPGSYPGHPGMHGTAVLPAGAVPAHAPPTNSGKGRIGLVLLVLALFLLGAGAVGGAFLFLGEDSPGRAVAEADAVEGIPAPEPTAIPEPEPAAVLVEEAPPVPTPATPTAVRRDRPPAASPDPAPNPTPEPAARPDPVREPDPRPEPPRPEPTPPPVAPRPPPRPRPPARGLTQQQVSQVVNARMQHLNERCYQRRVRRVPNLAGVVTVAWTVAANGRVENAQVVHNGTHDDWLGRCTRQVIDRLRFPASSNGASTPVRYPFTFRQGG